MHETLFVVLEGNDGAGKTSLRKRLYTLLDESGYEALTITPFSWRDVPATEVIIDAKYHQAQLPPRRITAATYGTRSA